MNCLTCQYFADFTDLGMGIRCMNKMNSPREGDFMTINDLNYSCSHYFVYSSDRLFEWDENKNESNKNKHGIGFARVHDLIKDEHMLQMVEKPEKWEDLSTLPDHVEKNEGNADPVRGKWIGVIDEKIFTAIYTFRGAIGEMRSRIISLRRADGNECNAYEEFKKK